MSGYELAQKMKPEGVRVEFGGFRDFYEPSCRTVHLSRDTGRGNNMEALAAAAHECGHALQHVANSSLWRLHQRLSGPALNGALFGLVLVAVLMKWHPWSVSIAGSLLLISRVLVVLAVEAQASELALLWMQRNDCLQPGMDEHLRKLAKSYWSSTVKP